MHIHVLYDPTWFDLLLKSIAQCIKFIGGFGDEQRQFRQKCQFVCSTHLFAPKKLLSRAFMARLRTAAGESLLALQIKSHVVAVARVAEVDARRGGFGGETASTRPKWRFVNL